MRRYSFRRSLVLAWLLALASCGSSGSSNDASVAGLPEGGDGDVASSDVDRIDQTDDVRATTPDIIVADAFEDLEAEDGPTPADATSEEPSATDASGERAAAGDVASDVSDGAVLRDIDDADGSSCPCVCTPTGCPAACASFATDPLNCGFAGHDCRGSACAAGQCAPSSLPVSGLYPQAPGSVAIEGSDIFWQEIGLQPGLRGHLEGRSLIDGSIAPGTIGVIAVHLIAVNSTHIFVTSTFTNVLTSNPRRHGAMEWPRLVNDVEAAAMVLDETSLYWTSNTRQTVQRLPLSAVGADAPIAPIVLATDQRGPWGVAVDRANLYWASRVGQSIKKLALSGGVPTTLVSSLTEPAELVVDATHAYWTDPAEGTIRRVSIDGGEAEVVAAGQDVPHKIVRDASGVYWTNRAAIGRVASVMKATGVGCTPITLASAPRGAGGIALSADRVYWSVPITSDGAGGVVPGSILSVPK